MTSECATYSTLQQHCWLSGTCFSAAASAAGRCVGVCVQNRLGLPLHPAVAAAGVQDFGVIPAPCTTLKMGGGAPSLSVTARPEAGAAATLRYGSTAPNKNTKWQVHHCCCCCYCWCCCSLKPCQLATATAPTSRACSHTHGLCRYE